MINLLRDLEKEPERRRVRIQIVLLYNDSALFSSFSGLELLAEAQTPSNFHPLKLKKAQKKTQFKDYFLNSEAGAPKLQDWEKSLRTTHSQMSNVLLVIARITITI